MGFHRLIVPVYPGGLRPGDDYINNAVAGTPAPADGPLGAGTYAGSYFFPFGGQATGDSFNRSAKALAENCDFLDDELVALTDVVGGITLDLAAVTAESATSTLQLARDIATPTRTSDVVAPVITGGLVLVTLIGPGIFLGAPTHPATPDGLELLYEILDENDNEILSGGVQCRVTSIAGGVVGGGFSAGNIDLTVSPGIPSGTTYRVYHGVKTNLATMPIDALTMLSIRGAQEVPSDLRAPSGAALVGFAGSGDWADTTTNPATTVEAQLDKIVSDLAGATGSAKIYSATVAGANFSLAAGTLYSQLSSLSTAFDSLKDSAVPGATLVGAAAVPGAYYSLGLGSLSSQLSTLVGAANTNAANLVAMAPTLIPGLRLTLTSGYPQGGANTSGSTLYYSPLTHGCIGLYDGTKWVVRETAEVSMSIAGILINTNYDVFARWSGAAVVLSVAQWTTDTARVALARQNGILVKGGDSTFRYIGTIRGSAASTTADSSTQRFVWNYYNRKRTRMARMESTGNWSVSNAGSTYWRRANNSATNRLEFVVGETYLNVDVRAFSVGVVSAGVGVAVGPGIAWDATTTANQANLWGGISQTNSGVMCEHACFLADTPPGGAEGYHALNWLEIIFGNGASTTTYYSNGTTGVSGIEAWLDC